MKTFPKLQNLFGMATALCAFALAAQESQSLVPAFVKEGRDFTNNGQEGHKLKGWLPKDWVDNSEWAQVNATYSKLDDPPKEGVIAVRIQVEKVDDGQLQLTCFQKRTYKKGVKYVVEGWVRSKGGAGLNVGIRQLGEPYEFYAEQPLEGAAEWKRFTFEFSFSEDREGIVMFYKPETGTVDLAGVVVREKKD